MIEPGDLELVADRLYTEALIDDDETTLPPARLVTRLLGPGSLERVRGMYPLGELSKVHDEPRIAIRAGMPKQLEQFIIGHELGHWALEREGAHLSAPEEEQAANFISAALIMRRKPFRRRAHDATWRQLAFDFGVTETAAVLRVGELTGAPLAVVTPAQVYARGEVEWPDEGTVRRWARAPLRGLRAVRLGDDRRRVVVDASAAA